MLRVFDSVSGRAWEFAFIQVSCYRCIETALWKPWAKLCAPRMQGNASFMFYIHSLKPFLYILFVHLDIFKYILNVQMKKRMEPFLQTLHILLKSITSFRGFHSFLEWACFLTCWDQIQPNMYSQNFPLPHSIMSFYLYTFLFSPYILE